jgi:hypothetical protein
LSGMAGPRAKAEQQVWPTHSFSIRPATTGDKEKAEPPGHFRAWRTIGPVRGIVYSWLVFVQPELRGEGLG